MKLTLAAAATEKISNRWLPFLNRTYTQPVEFATTVPDSASFTVPVPVPKGALPSFLLLALPLFLTGRFAMVGSRPTLALGIRAMGMDIAIKTITLAQSVATTGSYALDWSWRGIGLKGMLFVGDVPAAG